MKIFSAINRDHLIGAAIGSLVTIGIQKALEARKAKDLDKEDDDE